MARRRTSPARLLITILVSIFLFIGLAMGENYGRRFLEHRQADRADAAADAAVERVVERYAQLLAEAYVKTTPSLLERENVATARQIGRVRNNMAYNHFQKKQKLLTKLKEQKIKGASRKGAEAEVEAVEIWINRYIDEKTGATISEGEETLNVKYRLVKIAGEWLVDDLAAKDL